MQQIERMVRIARELGREVATGKEARAIYRIGTRYQSTEETLAKLGQSGRGLQVSRSSEQG